MLLVTLLVTAAAACVATARAALPSLDPHVKSVFAQSVAGTQFLVDCTYADRNSEAEAFPRYKNLPPEIYAKPWICAALNAFARQRPAGGTDASRQAAAAILVFTHESVHLSSFAGARDEAQTECRALALVPSVAARLGAPSALAAELGDEAVAPHDRLLARYPSYAGAGC